MANLTLGQLDALCLPRVDGNSLLYTAVERYRIINEALRVMNLFCGFYQRTIQVPGFSLAAQLLYRVPTGILIPTRVAFEYRPLDPISLPALARSYPTWAQDTTQRRGPVAHWFPLGIGIFGIHPMDSDGGNDIQVTGVSEPPLLANPTVDSMVLEDEWVEAIVEYFAHRAPLKEGAAIFSASAKLYQSFLRRMKDRSIHENLRLPQYFLKSVNQGAKE